VAVHAVGHEKAVMPTIKHGENQRLGCADYKRIKLSGLNWDELVTVPLNQVITADTRPDNLYDKTLASLIRRSCGQDQLSSPHLAQAAATAN
jgi:hypothetical protein